MDCPTCGYALAPLETKCSRCQRIAQEKFARSPAAIWPPAIGPAAAEPPLRPLPSRPLSPYLEDTSEHNSSGKERGCPLEIAELHWNWGAFFCGWLWCFLNALPGLAVLVLAVGGLLTYFTFALLPQGYAIPSELVALVLFGLHCHLGIKGHQLSWEHRRFFGGAAQFFAVQRAWLVGGAVAFGLTASLLTFSAVAFFKAFNAYEVRRQHPVVVSPPVAASGPAPIVLRAAPPAGVSPSWYSSPVYGGQGFRHPWDGPGRVRYRPGYGPGDVRTAPDGPAETETPQPANVPQAPAPQFPSSAGFSGNGSQVNDPQTNNSQPTNAQTNSSQGSAAQSSGPESGSPQSSISPGSPASSPSASSPTLSTGTGPPAGMPTP